MADIRINALPTTATDFASDDYIAIDGTTNGTRKLNAKTANLTFSDVTLGTSGPSVKSSLSARAPRQGLVFDGTAGATVTNVPAFGTGDFTVVGWLNPTSLSLGYETYIVGGSSGSFAMRMENTTGVLSFLKIGGGLLGNSTTALSAGKNTFVVFSRSGSTNTFYFNGVAVGTPVSDSTNYTTGITKIGDTSSVYPWNGLITPLIYNRALSASEVVALYEAGDPAGADYNNASNTSLLTGANSDFSSAGNWNVTGSTTISGGKLNLSTGDAAWNALALLSKGKRYRLTITVDSITAGIVEYYNGSSYVTFASTAGTYTVEFTCAATFSPGLHLRSSGGNAVLDTALYYPLGLLLAPDAAQAGGGLTWYDTSGNAANITLPASGVTWNVPTSGKMATSLNVNAAASLFASTSNSTSISDVDTTAAFITKGSGTPRLYFGNENAANRPFLQAGVGGGALFMCIQPYGGNALFGSLTDSGNGKIQLATHTTSAGGIGFGTDVSVYRTSISALAFNGTTGDPQFQLARGGTVQASFLLDGASVYFGSASTQPLIFRTNNTTALTLDSSQNATFAGRSSATTAYGTAKSVTVDFATSTATNVTRTFTVTIPSPGLAGTFLLEVGVYGNGATGLGSLLVKGYGYFGSTSLYDATEISKVSTGNVTVSSITKGNGSFTFTVLDTTSSALVAVKYSQTSDAAITTLPTITSA